MTQPEFGFVADPLALLNAAHADRYAIERELGRGVVELRGDLGRP